MDNNFELIPAIDILDGKCVRLTQGKYDLVEEFSNDPVEIAKKWAAYGIKRLHLVDLDGAKAGKPINKEQILKIKKAVNLKIEVGGGIRSLESIKEYINEGISYVILGTKAFQDKSFLDEAINLFKEKIIVGMDLKNKKIATSGWLSSEDMDFNMLKEYLSNVHEIICTDISKDGMLSGPNFDLVQEIAGIFPSKIIVSGGIASINDINKLLELKNDSHKNISGVILGKSLYKGTIDLSSAIKNIQEKK